MLLSFSVSFHIALQLDPKHLRVQFAPAFCFWSPVLHAHFRVTGVKYVFGYSGGAILPALDGLYGSSIEFIQNANELCSGHIAEVCCVDK